MSKILQPIEVTLVVSRLGGFAASWREGFASMLLGRRGGVPGGLELELSIPIWAYPCGAWAAEAANQKREQANAVSSIAMSNEEAASTIADLSLDDWVNCLVDWLYVGGLLCKNVWTHYEKRTHLAVDSVKRIDSFESTWLWQIEEFLCDHMLILSNIRGHLELSSTHIEQLTMFQNKKTAKVGGNRDKKWPSSLWAAALILLSHSLNHSLFQRNNIVAFCLKDAVSHKNHNSAKLWCCKDVFATPQNAKKMFFKFGPSLPPNFWWCAVDLWVDCWGPSFMW